MIIMLLHGTMNASSHKLHMFFFFHILKGIFNSAHTITITISSTHLHCRAVRRNSFFHMFKIILYFKMKILTREIWINQNKNSFLSSVVQLIRQVEKLSINKLSQVIFFFIWFFLILPENQNENNIQRFVWFRNMVLSYALVSPEQFVFMKLQMFLFSKDE